MATTYTSIHGDILDALVEHLQRMEGPDGDPLFKWVDIGWDFPPTVAFPAAFVVPSDDGRDGQTNASEDVRYNDDVLVAVKDSESPKVIVYIRQLLREQLWTPDTTNAIPHAYDLNVEQSPILSGQHKVHGNLVLTVVRVQTVVAEDRH